MRHGVSFADAGASRPRGRVRVARRAPRAPGRPLSTGSKRPPPARHHVEPVPDAFRTRRRGRSAVAGRPGPCASRSRAAALALAAAVALPAGAQSARLLVVQSADSPRLVRTLAALRERSPLPVDVVPLPHDAHELSREWSRSGRGSVLVALGPRASDAVVEVGLGGAAVHCLAGADALRAGLPAVPSEVPVDQQAAWLGRLLPRARTVGLLYDPAINTRRAEAHAAGLALAGYRTLQQPVASPADLPHGLERLAGRADVLLALPDGTVYTHESSRGLLLYSFRKRIPLVGPGEQWVKRGALYALDWDYADVGAACAALAARESNPRAPAAVAQPRIRVSVNTKSAGHFGVAWPDDLLRLVDARHE